MVLQRVVPMHQDVSKPVLVDMVNQLLLKTMSSLGNVGQLALLHRGKSVEMIEPMNLVILHQVEVLHLGQEIVLEVMLDEAMTIMVAKANLDILLQLQPAVPLLGLNLKLLLTLLLAVLLHGLLQVIVPVILLSNQWALPPDWPLLLD